jgi:Phage tail tube protein
MGWSSNRPTDYFAIGVQTAVGTEAATFRFPKHLTGSGFELTPDTAEEREGGGGQEVALAYKKMIKADGNLVLNARGVGAVYAAIDSVLGNTATVLTIVSELDTASPACQKVRMVLSPTLPYTTIEQRWSDNIERVSNAKSNQLTIDYAAGLPVKLSLALTGAGTVYQRDPAASSLTTVYDVTDPIYFPRGSYVITGGIANVASGAKITKAKVTVQRHLDEAIQTTDLYRDDLIELTTDTALDLTLKYEDRTFYNYVQEGGGSFVPLPISSLSFTAYSTNQVASAAANGGTTVRSMKVGMVNLLTRSAKVNKLEPDGKTVYIDVACTSIKPAGATDSLVIDLVVPSSVYTNYP